MINILDKETNKVYKVPEDLLKMGRDILGIEQTHGYFPMMLDRKISHQLDEWYLSGDRKAMMLNPDRFSISFEGLIPEEKVRESIEIGIKEVNNPIYAQSPLSKFEFMAVKESWKSALKFLAASLNINLSPEGANQ